MLFARPEHGSMVNRATVQIKGIVRSRCRGKSKILGIIKHQPSKSKGRGNGCRPVIQGRCHVRRAAAILSRDKWVLPESARLGHRNVR
jgi:hypothetical protein